MSFQASMKKINYLKAVFTILMAAYGIICALNPSDLHFLDRVNLIAHEAGHLLFGWFGEYLMVLGERLASFLSQRPLWVIFF